MRLRILAIVLMMSLASTCGGFAGPAQTARQSAGRTAPLRAVFGPPSQAGFGGAVFSEHVDRPQDLEIAARRCYRDFLGKQWGDGGVARWMAVWRRAYTRPQAQQADITAELRGIATPEVRSSFSALLEAHDTPDAAKQALSAAYDDAAVENREVYTLGDGTAFSGLLIAGRATNGSATLLVFMLD